MTRYDIWRAVNKPDEYTKISSVDSGVGSWVDPECVYSAQTDSLLRYRVYAWYDSSGVSGLSDPAYSGVANGHIGLRKGALAGRTAESQLLPKANAIACYPNPFNPSTTFKVSLVSDAEVRMEIYDIMGRRVKMLADGQRSAGYHSMTWDGTDAAGRPVASGIYLYRFVATPPDKVQAFKATGKLMLTK